MRDKWVKVAVLDLYKRTSNRDRSIIFQWWIVNGKYLFGETSLKNAKASYKVMKSIPVSIMDNTILSWKDNHDIVVINNKLAKLYYDSK